MTFFKTLRSKAISLGYAIGSYSGKLDDGIDYYEENIDDFTGTNLELSPNY